ncbi:MAG TPA: DUF1080 domain-containing protein [Gammaproteobacteria bacterium]|jgi:hypothetical protein|nr:DUF1080 domain-containing protein [Gammaproteobacteria bacterium]MDP6731534.1 DUF1080 domain-containing protein [Gammaproteobacteria bacterium]HAJ77249.1 DUF1080 domain-containing protein [Gammaproteobacteria bacterium]
MKTTKQLNLALPAVFVSAVLICVQTSNSAAADTALLNSLTAAEIADGWKLLFDGKTTVGWRGYRRETVPGSWQILDGSLFMDSSARSASGTRDRGDILYDQQFENFHLKLEWKISEGGNSGIFYLGQEPEEQDVIYKTAPEVQVLDNDRHPDARAGIDGNRTAGSLYDLIPARPQNVNPVGEWNTAEVIVNNGSVQHYQNGEVIVEFQLGTKAWHDLVAGSKFPSLNADWADVARRGYIALQDHGDDVWYRNIKIKEL